jgi:hypothetical protein
VVQQIAYKLINPILATKSIITVAVLWEREIWVFIVIDTTHKPVISYLEIIGILAAQTLESTIQPGSTIHSTSWALYDIQPLPGF